MSTITLPSGLVGEVRGLSGKDGRYLTNEQLVRDNEVEDYIFSNCWNATIDDGPYKFEGRPPDWSKVLVGDRFFALIAVREATYPGKEYVIKLQCARLGCKRRFEWEIDLRELLAKKTKTLSAEDRATFQESNRFKATVPFTEKSFVFQLNTGAIARRTQALLEAKKTGNKKMQQRQNTLCDILSGLILEVDGVALKRDAIFDFLEELPMASIDALLPLVQSHDCGVETDIEVECPFCGGGMVITLPFDRAFFLPYSSEAKRAAASSAKEEEDVATAAR